MTKKRVPMSCRSEPVRASSRNDRHVTAAISWCCFVGYGSFSLRNRKHSLADFHPLWQSGNNGTNPQRLSRPAPPRSRAKLAGRPSRNFISTTFHFPSNSRIGLPSTSSGVEVRVPLITKNWRMGGKRPLVIAIDFIIPSNSHLASARERSWWSCSVRSLTMTVAGVPCRIGGRKQVMIV
ncbi:hypothetical protein GE21DRAFT_1120637 [Neurospora crassa]|nr:hypothetical protein GE21DRAFT_1120637 [Neurospora crassa]